MTRIVLVREIFGFISLRSLVLFAKVMGITLMNEVERLSTADVCFVKNAMFSFTDKHHSAFTSVARGSVRRSQPRKVKERDSVVSSFLHFSFLFGFHFYN